MRYILLVFLMLAGMFSVYAQTLIPQKPDGEGTSGNPFLIGTAEELLWFADEVNGVHNDNVGMKSAKLINDINNYGPFTGNDQINRAMIGNAKEAKKSFRGTFDGDGYTINIDFKVASGASFDCVGLFGFASGTSTVIKNLTVTGNLEIKGKWWHIGGILGGDFVASSTTPKTIITNCKSSVLINTIKEASSSTSSTSEADISVGGIMGCSYGFLMMDLCGFTGNIESLSRIGARASIDQYVIVGGLVGFSAYTGSSNIENHHIRYSYVFIPEDKVMTLKQEGNSSSSKYYFYPICGGRNYGTKMLGSNESAANNLRTCYYYGKVKFNNDAVKTPVDKNSKSPFTAWHNNINKTNNNVSDIKTTLPDILEAIYANVTPAPTMMYIKSAEDMESFARLVNKGKNGLNAEVRKCFTYSGTSVGTSGYKYSGTFNGNNHTITLDKKLSDGGSYALFNYVENTVISNLTVDGVIDGGKSLSGLILYAYGDAITISNCISRVRFRIPSSNPNNIFLGGIIGTIYNNCEVTLRNCASVPFVEGTDNTYIGGYIFNMEGSYVILDHSYSQARYTKLNTIKHLSYNGLFQFTNVDNSSYSNDKTDEQYNNGTVCYLLNGNTSNVDGPWYQDLSDPNSLPVHAKCGCPGHTGENKVVYKNDYKPCPGLLPSSPLTESRYENVDVAGAVLFAHPDHENASLSDGVFHCDICGDHYLDAEDNYIIKDDVTLSKFASLSQWWGSWPQLKNAVVLSDITANAGCSVGSVACPYNGTFDGGFNTITVSGSPLFNVVSNAKIKNLVTTGTVGGPSVTGGLIAKNISSGVSIEKCLSTTSFSNTSRTVGGLIGSVDVAGSWTVNNCGFAGSFPDGIQKAGGIVADVNSGSGTIGRSYVFYTGSNYTTGANYYTFAPSGSTISNCYYNREIGSGRTGVGIRNVNANFANGTVKDALNTANSGNKVWYNYTSGNPGRDYPTIVGYVWQGSDGNTDWAENSNWKKGIAPTTAAANPAYSSITIPAVGEIGKTYPHISTSVDINSVDVMPTAEMHIDAADIIVNINGTVNNRGTFAVNYGDSYTAVQGSPNVVISGASPANVTVKRYLLPRVMYYTGSATAEGLIQEGYDYAANKDYLAFFNATTQDFDTSIRRQGNFPAQYIGCTVGLGAADATSFTQKGTVHNTDAISVPLKAGYNWLSNPYPYSAMAWDKDAGKGLLPQNTGEDMSPTVWVRKNGGSGSYIYVTYNAKLNISAYGPDRSADAAKFIAPFQDYCILVNNAGTYTINGVLAKDEGSTVNSKLKSAQIETPMDVVRLNVITDGKEDIDDQAVVVLREDGILGASNLDSNKYPTSSYSQISVYKAGSNTNYAIGLYPSADDVENDEIPVTVTAVKGAKQLTIAADLSALTDGYDIILIDHATEPQTEVNLRTEQGYTFAASGLTAKRFGIVVRRNDSYLDSSVEDSGVPTDIEYVETNRRFVAYSVENNIIVELGSADQGNAIKVVDLTGRMVTMIKQSQHYNILPMAQKGIYVVVVGDQSRKIMVK